ncbi:bud22 family protein [Moniliophthora roreri MCA 2997]|uniref:Bud22 family protein n=2 Tax=Moniliophthora roreri TaxID=221103 RepID=V2XR28_MONRO|nr:bud22 family protein [Moniliophthora roreri MCA 2997]KAI3607860.1 bud22 family protein [Moniliophthora roreri]
MKPSTGTQNRGVKRKRQENPKEKDLNAKMVGKLHHDLKEVRKAAKKAKAFETQKLIKKLKGLRLKNGSEADITECESQLEELKEINTEAVANTALRSKLSKDKQLSKTDLIQAAMSTELEKNLLLPAAGSSPAGKVQSRLLSSKILAVGVASALEDLRLVIHPPAGSVDGDSDDERPAKMKKLTARDEDGDVNMDLEDDLADVGEEDENDGGAGWESGTVGDDEKEPDDDGWESDSLGSGEVDEYMDEDSPEEAGATISDHGLPPKPSPQARMAQSTFLPALSTGFIRGDSSDWSDSEAKAADIEKKKNRRGQRARRAIWEKKYGRNANHKKKEVAESGERGRKHWPSSANDGGSNRGLSSSRSIKTSRPDGSGRQTDSAPHQHMANTARSQRLHPSWEAKKKLKEKQSAAITPPPPGRKIRFS